MDGEEGFDLKWKDHANDVFGQVKNLRSRDHFSDVTVHCGGRNFRAHKVLLAASSSFFERVFLSAPKERSQVLVMVETSPDLLERVLEFIYEGEAFVAEDLLDDFMDLVEKLGIRGLRKNHSAEAVSRDNSPKKRSADAPVNLPQKRLRPDTSATRPGILRARLSQPLPAPDPSRNVCTELLPRIVDVICENCSLWKFSFLACFWRQYVGPFVVSNDRGCNSPSTRRSW
jgi:hypothetical protein